MWSTRRKTMRRKRRRRKSRNCVIKQHHVGNYLSVIMSLSMPNWIIAYTLNVLE
jgi:hypothetical protein